MITKDNFECTKCGECCRPLVMVNEEDIARIEQAGHKDFVDIDHLEEKPVKVLKQKLGVCMFLKKQGEDFVCSIYHHRPEICRKYPFVEPNIKLKDCYPEGYQRWMPLKEVMEEF